MNFRLTADDLLGVKSLPDPSAWLHDRIMADAISAKDADELSNSQKFALCFCAGIPMKTEMRESKMHMETAQKCGFAKIDGKWHIFTMPGQSRASASTSGQRRAEPDSSQSRWRSRLSG